MLWALAAFRYTGAPLFRAVWEHAATVPGVLFTREGLSQLFQARRARSLSQSPPAPLEEKTPRLEGQSACRRPSQVELALRAEGRPLGLEPLPWQLLSKSEQAWIKAVRLRRRPRLRRSAPPESPALASRRSLLRVSPSSSRRRRPSTAR